jgi:hypothetical protein
MTSSIRCLLLAGLAAAAPATLYGQNLTFSAPISSNSAWDNHYFNIRAGAQPLTIRSFRIASAQGDAATWSVYSHPGDFRDTETDASAWTLASATPVTPPGTEQTDLFELPANVIIPAGEVVAFVIADSIPNDNGMWSGVAPAEDVSNNDLTAETTRFLSRQSESTGVFDLATIGGGFRSFGGEIIYRIGTNTLPTVIVTQPVGATVIEGQALAVSVQADGSGRLDFQWSRGGTAIAGETNSSFTRAIAALTDAGTYSVTVRGGDGRTVVSSNAMVSVTPDVTPPSVQGSSVSDDITTVTITFSEPIQGATPAAFRFSGGASATNVSLNPAGTIATLGMNGLRLGTAYSVGFSGITDRAATPNPLPSSEVTAFVTSRTPVASGPISENSAWDNHYFNITAGSNAVIIRAFQFASLQTDTTTWTVFVRTNGGWEDNQFAESEWAIAGSEELTPPGGTPEDLFRIPVQVTIPAGQTYGFLVADAISNDNGKWSGFSPAEDITNADFTIGPERYHSRDSEQTNVFTEATVGNGSRAFGGVVEYCVGECPTNPPVVVVSRQPQSVTVPALTPVAFSVGVSPARQANSFQWLRNGTEIPGANAAVYAPPLACPAESGTTFAVRVTPPEGGPSTVSSNAVLTLTPPTNTGPVTLSYRQGVGPFEDYNMFAGYITPGQSFEGTSTYTAGNDSDGYVGRHLESAPFINRMVFLFDLGLIPTNAVIQSASLTILGTPFEDGLSTAASYNLHELLTPAALASLGESSFNWRSPWTNRFGGDFNSNVLATVSVAAQTFSNGVWTSSALSSLVQTRVQAPRPLLGLLLKGLDEELRATTLLLDTDDIASASRRPEFSVTFTVPDCAAAPARPVLAVRQEGTNLVVTWQGAGFQLQQTPALGPLSWSPVAASSPASIPINTNSVFLRLVQ